MKNTEETVKSTEVRGKIGGMSTPTITEFLIARIREDEASARAVAAGPDWTVDEESYAVLHNGNGICYDVASEEVARHIARHDPTRILAECAAKMAIVDYCSGQGVGLRAEWRFEVGEQFMDALWLAVKLAEVYSSHPDYRQEWKL